MERRRAIIKVSILGFILLWIILAGFVFSWGPKDAFKTSFKYRHLIDAFTICAVLIAIVPWAFFPSPWWKKLYYVAAAITLGCVASGLFMGLCVALSLK